MKPYLLMSLAVMMLAGCAATPTLYGPAGEGARATGYDELQVEDDRWRVSFTAGPTSSAERTRALALRRAAELVLEAGYEGFELVSEDVRRTGSGDSPLRVGGSVGVGMGSGGWSGSGVGIGIGISPDRERRTTVILEIIATASARPAGGGLNSHAHDHYDARAVLAAAGVTG
ncbi:MAG: hypothetical protein AAFX09_14020 [Pseudomonadota bacterium]